MRTVRTPVDVFLLSEYIYTHILNHVILCYFVIFFNGEFDRLPIAKNMIGISTDIVL